MRWGAGLLLASVLMVAAGISCGGQAISAGGGDGPDRPADKGIAEVSFQFDRPGVPVPHFILRVREDGTGSYQAEQAERRATATSMRGEEAKLIDRTLVLRPATVEKIFKTARELNDFNMTCASKAKNIADTGKKTLSYAGSDGRGSCVYNYSEDKRVGMLTEMFTGIAFTMDEGRILEFLHRYDRLGLDAEMNTLARELEAGRAQELGTISQTLTVIATDEAVMQRVRLRAVNLMEQGK
jgi:hypothetical protein